MDFESQEQKKETRRTIMLGKDLDSKALDAKVR
jgi:hypothetical protein